MRLHILIAAAGALVLAACGPDPNSSAPRALRKIEYPKPPDESRRFSKANLVETKVVERELMGKPFMPGGTLARYRKGKVEYEMFVAKVPGGGEAALLLPDWSKALAGAKLVPSFGGYFGTDGGRPVFVFSKGVWIAGISGLSEKEADGPARKLATMLN